MRFKRPIRQYIVRSHVTNVDRSLDERNSHFLKYRFEAGVDQERPKPWTVKQITNSKQPDGTSYGVFVIKFAENFLSNRSLMLKCQRSDIASERRNIALRLINAVHQVDSVQTGEEEEEEEEMPKSPMFNRTGPTKRRYLQGSPESRRTMRSPHPKRKGTSFIYQDISKKSRKYCICQQPDDGRIYWQCETCRQWFHPECIGRDVKNEPDKLHCDQCQWRGVLLHLEGISECIEDSCKEEEHQRHHRFIKDPLAITKKERKMFGFVNDCFEDEAIEWIRDRITSLLTADLHPIRLATSARIVTVPGVPKHSRLYSIFMDYDLAGTYIVSVLMKETLIYMLCVRNGMPYEMADRQCSTTELNSKAIFGR